MADLIPVHYHLLPRTTGTDVIYPDGLMLWDVNNRVIVAGDGITPGGVVLGAAGTPGANGTGIRPRGLHSMAVAYLEHDAVSKDGSFWRAKQDHTGQLPPTLPTQENAYWDILTERGAQGEQGIQGPAGADGADGADGAPFVYTDFTTEQLALLVGPEGPEGPRGPAGTDGAKGDKGDQGPAGADGTDGADGLANPMTTAGDIIVGSTDGAPARLAKGADGKVLGVEAGAVAWVTPTGGGGGSVITACVLPVPSDPDEDALHFEAELSLDPLFEAAGSIFVKSATGYANIKVFSGLQWIPFPSDGIGLPFYGSHVRFDVVAEGVYYGRARWWDGTAWSDYRGFIFPSISI